SHTILLIQPSPKNESRTYSDYNSLKECLEAICKMFEEHLKKLNPSKPSITYDISNLFDFIDDFPDLTCLVLQKNAYAYSPLNKDSIKEKIYDMLRSQAGR
ncbi:uncharacterized protein TRIADDRAFT_26253, partial [Trichoplax adhaerens]